MSWDGDASLSRALASSLLLPGAVLRLLLLFLPALCLGQRTKAKVCLCLPLRPPLPRSEAQGRRLVPSGVLCVVGGAQGDVLAGLVALSGGPLEGHGAVLAGVRVSV